MTGAAGRGAAGQAWRATTWSGTALAIGLTLHTVWNLRRLRTPLADPPPVTERVSLLLPARDEAARIGPCLSAALAQERLADLEILVLDDRSTDGTANTVRAVAAGDPRVRLLDGVEPAPGWLGKPHACQQLADAATGAVLVFLDADVLLEPLAVAATVGLLRTIGLQLVSPYPRQLAVTPGERLVQPLLQWSWLTTLPLGLAERSARASLSAANGQLLAVDAAAYRRSGGHAAVRDQVLDDVALLRAVKATGGHGTVVDGTNLATCRMYDSWPALRDGYTKSLWSAFGSPGGAAGAIGLLALAYLVPPLAALRGSRAGAAGYLAAVAGRVLVARRTGGRAVPDALAHPGSIGLLGWLTVSSWRRRRRGDLTWKGRTVIVPAHPSPGSPEHRGTR